jgi:hypothetical protein
MASNAAGQQPSAEREWFIVGRWEEFGGEGRANLLRVIGIATFYAVECLNYFGVNLGPLQMPSVVDRPFHLAVTALAVAWAMVGAGVFLCRRSHIFPWSLKFISTGCDLLLLTSVLTLADGPRSPLLIGYFVVLALAALRLSLPLIWFATIGSAAGYLFLLGYARWFTERDVRVPRYYELVFLLGVVLTGVVLGQVLRRVRHLSERVCPTGQS